jgi:hypothetical protein
MLQQNASLILVQIAFQHFTTHQSGRSVVMAQSTTQLKSIYIQLNKKSISIWSLPDFIRASHLTKDKRTF